ncbi:DNA/RNA non-specific endonuclease [Enterococcus faecalis]
MAKRTKKAPTRSTAALIITLIILTLTALGVQVPDVVQELFGLPVQEKQTTTTKPQPSGSNPGPIENGAATFTQTELKNKNKGWIVYHPLDQYRRATGADALLKPNMVNTGTSANKDIRPPGFISGQANHSRGHLIGRQLGGSGDDARNLTTLYQNPVNTPYMTKYENQVRQALDQGETIRYRVTPIYKGQEPLCTEIRIEAKGINTNSKINFSVIIYNES